MSYSPVQNPTGGTYLHTPPSIFQHMMGQQHAMPQMTPINIPRNTPVIQEPDISKFSDIKLCAIIVQRKRKLEDPPIEWLNIKQFITEEKIAADFKDMHISTSDQTHNAVPSTSEDSADSMSQTADLSDDLDMEGENRVDLGELTRRHPRLIISEELKRFQEEPILPSSLLSKLEKPTKALVLWEPPNKHLRVLPTLRNTPTPLPNSSNDNNNNNNSVNNNNNNNNNNESIPDLNQTQDNNSGIVLESMDMSG